MRPFRPLNALVNSLLCLRMKNKQLAKQEKHTGQKVLLICNTGQSNRVLVNFDFYE